MCDLREVADLNLIVRKLVLNSISGFLVRTFVFGRYHNVNKSHNKNVY